jgi:Recombinase
MSTALISRNTCAALAAMRARGVRLGRPRRCPDEVLARVLTSRTAGARLVDICAQLNADGVPTPGGGARWHPSHVSRLLRTQDARASRC